MSNRIYNILFHTHTISGIVISLGLYVIFFAGSFSFFRDEIVSWERNEPLMESSFKELDLNIMMDTLNQQHDTYSRDITFRKHYEEKRVAVNMSVLKDTTAGAERKGGRGDFFYMHEDTFKTYDYAANYSIGEFLYRLHFLAQLNVWGQLGYLLAGIISFFFLFAIITGVLVHWKKIISNFYVFRPRASLKNLWTDAHTALGIIGLPFQFVYAVTGAFLIIGTAVMAPPVLSLIYEGDEEEMYADFGFNNKEFPLAMGTLPSPPEINPFIEKAYAKWPDFHINSVTLHNYGDSSMYITIGGALPYSQKFTGEGELIFKVISGEIVGQKDPYQETSYLDGALGVIHRLHYGDFGGVALKITYFLLGIISCFVIISGILIWLVARDKKHVAERKRKFNAWVGWIYLAVCLSMYPVTAFTFLAVKLFVNDFDASRLTSIYQIFFYSWLVLSILFTLKKDNYFTNKFTLLLGSFLGFLVPLANGVISGNWLWKTFAERHFDIFLIDAFWLVLAAITFFVALGLKKKEQSGQKVSKENNKRPQAVTETVTPEQLI